MSLRNTSEEYGRIAKYFHWLSAILLVTLLLVGWLMDKTDPSIKGTVYNIHKLFGLLFLTLTIPRLVWAVSNIKPKLPSAMRLWEKVAERIVHGGLYLSLLLMPLLGWGMSTAAGRAPTLFGTSIPLPGIIHNSVTAQLFASYHATFAWVIVLLVSLHVGAALKHHFIDKDNVLLTMMPKKKKKDIYSS